MKDFKFNLHKPIIFVEDFDIQDLENWVEVDESYNEISNSTIVQVRINPKITEIVVRGEAPQASTEPTETELMLVENLKDLLIDELIKELKKHKR